MADSSKRDTRGRIFQALRRELMGPSHPDETITEFPTSRYIIGRLAPALEPDHEGSDEDIDGRIDPLENDTLEVGPAGDEESTNEAQAPLIMGFHPSSMGLSFLLSDEAKALNVRITWGDYRREKSKDDGRRCWQRYCQETVLTGISVEHEGKIPKIPLSQDALPAGVAIAGTEDQELTIEGVIHRIGDERAVSLFLVNRRTRGLLSDKSKDERWIFQPQIEVFAPADAAVFSAKKAHEESTDDGERAITELLYRNAQEFATGHGVAAGWSKPTSGDKRVSRVFTEFIPDFEVPSLIAPVDATGGAELDMRTLSQVKTGAEVSSLLQPMVDAYENWIALRRDETTGPPFVENTQYADTAKELIHRCAEAEERMSAGLELLESDPLALEAFKFSNEVMWDQRIHSIWASENRERGEVEGDATSFDIPRNRTWRPFQMGFILLNLVGLAREESRDRQLVDLLWFPTGGGKTEAYLGLAAFVLAYRRLRGDRNGKVAGAGVNIIMRYTLRLLTVQQFQRAAALICSCELYRKRDPEKWGTEPFRIGLWVGANTTPNTSSDSDSALQDLNDNKKPKKGSPVQLVSCPRCGTALATDKGIPENQTYTYDAKRRRTLVRCRNRHCEFCPRESGNEGLPVVVVDEELYRTRPSLLIATVDKFARMPFKGEIQAFFGARDRYSKVFEHLTQAQGEDVSGLTVRDAVKAPHLLPPELIIQDELHLISGPLGTMVGLYESAIDFLSRARHESGQLVPAKIIASTATIRRAGQQVRQLYNRELAIFPPSGLTSKDSFFAKELEIDSADDSTSGRLYVGLNAPGSSSKTLLVRVYAVLLAAVQAEIDIDPTSAAAADPYATLVGYFNSLRALGGAKRLVEDDVKNVRLWYLQKQRNFPRRMLNDPEELTSRLDSWKIPGLLKKLDKSFPRKKGELHPVDVLLATNMISVGVDIDRLGLMVVTGQPKTTAEYIQATSRIGRKHPGLVVTMYNWMGARDLSHYEQFYSYHEALYRHVEAISVTPFASRALDRGLKGLFTAFERLSGQNMGQEKQAQNFDPAVPHTQEVIEDITARASILVGKENGDLVRRRLLSHRDEWAKLSDDLLRYSWLRDNRPPQNSRVLLKTAGTDNEGEWPTPGSLREVEPTAAFFLVEGED